MDYLDKGLKLIIADVLSIITISSCLIIKVPQIRTIQTLRSAKGGFVSFSRMIQLKLFSFVGISLVSLLLELCSYTTTMSYNFCKGYSYLSYMEYPILLIQEYVLIFVVLKYNNLLGSRTLMYACLYFTMATLFLTQIIPSSVLTFMVVRTILCAYCMDFIVKYNFMFFSHYAHQSVQRVKLCSWFLY